MIVRLCCECGRNLADVRRPPRNPAWTRDGLLVQARPNVRQDSYRPWHEANKAGPLGTPERAAATPGRVEGVDFDWHDRTYVWHCRCGRTHERRHERITAAWTAEHEAGRRGLVRLTLGLDL